MKTFSIAAILVAVLSTAVQAQTAATVHFTIDAKSEVKPISRFIYGVNHPLNGDFAFSTLRREGGNRWTAFNWVNNASNAGSDWHFQNDNNLGGGETPGGALLAAFNDASSHHAAFIVTIPMAGYVSADKKGDGDVRNSGKDYLETRFRKSEPAKGAPFTLTPDPKNPVVFQDEFVNWVNNKFPYGQTDPTRPIFYMLDNEADLWSETHAEVHPQKLTYAEIMQRSIAYATAIKKVAPKSLVFGPASYGWNGYVTLQNAPDADKRDFLEFYLQQMAAAEKKTGKRLLDVLDVHWYPEARGDNVRITEDGTKPLTVAARLQAPRSLWDSSYTETSWITQSIHQPINLIPRLMEKIHKDYPGTKLSISEYNYGASDHISGAIAQADALGIFGKYNVFAAALWPLSGKMQFTGAAFLMYRNFDGANGTFGDTSVSAATDNFADTSIYASTDSARTDEMILVAINKTDHPISTQMNLKNGPRYTRWDIYQLTSAAPSPQHLTQPQTFDPQKVSLIMPPYSVSTIRLAIGGK